jgi:hypothetical protein
LAFAICNLAGLFDLVLLVAQFPKGAGLLFYSFYSVPFTGFLGQITRIAGLIPDLYFRGAGLHGADDGGHLNIHAYFNHHAEMDLEPRISVPVYLNFDSKE